MGFLDRRHRGGFFFGLAWAMLALAAAAAAAFVLWPVAHGEAPSSAGVTAVALPAILYAAFYALGMRARHAGRP